MSDTKQCTLPMYGGAKRQMTTIRLRIVRRFSQFLMLALLGQWSFYGIFRCPFLAITSWGNHGSIYQFALVNFSSRWLCHRHPQYR
ncbi:MAG: hypothetical protein KJ630_18800 [Proteobacteria bacterium]|nr:hypothetical protein [Pseudomonadota bacterium]